MQRRLDLAVIVLIAAAANFLYFRYSGGDFFYPDSFTYLAPAKMLLAGYGFATQPHVPETLRTPVYPLLLILFGMRTTAVVIAQHLLNVLLAAAIYLFCMRRLRSRLVALTASIVFALDVVSLHYANKVLTETPFAALLFVVFLLSLEWRWPAVIGILCGVLVLLRPVAIVYFVALAFFFFMERRPKRAIAAFTIAALVMPIAWGVRNRVRTGVFTVASIAGSNMLLYRAAGALAMRSDAGFTEDLPDEQSELRDAADDEIQRTLRIDDAQDLPHAVRASWYGKIARRVILQHPFAFTLLTFRGVMVNLFESDWDAMQIVSSIEESTIQITIDAVTAAVILFAIVGVIALWRRDRSFAILIALTVAYYIVISAGGEAEARMRVPVVPQIAIAAACGVAAVKRGASPEPR